MSRPYTQTIDILRSAGLRPTRQRVGLSYILFNGGDRHVTADQLHSEADAAGLKVSLATVYNTLHQLCDAGLLAEVLVEPGRSYFDTNISVHHHFFNMDTGELADIPPDEISVQQLPTPPEGTAIDQVSIIVRVRQNP